MLSRYCAALALAVAAAGPSAAVAQSDQSRSAPETPSNNERQAAAEASSADDSGRGLFDCERVGWMQGCRQANETFREHPDSHVRTITENGTELIFPPSTPRAAIRFYTLQTPEAARAYIRHNRKVINHAERTSKLLQQQRAKMDIVTTPASVPGGSIINRVEARKIDPKKYKVFLFYRGRDNLSTHAMRATSALQLQYPELYISALQMDDTPDLLRALNDEYGLDARILRGSARETWQMGMGEWLASPSKGRAFRTSPSYSPLRDGGARTGRLRFVSRLTLRSFSV